MEIEERIRQYESDARMISENALRRTVMDDGGGYGMLRTVKYVNSKQSPAFIPLPSRSTRQLVTTISSMKQVRQCVSTFKRKAGIYSYPVSTPGSRLVSREGISRGSSLPTNYSSTLDSGGMPVARRSKKTNSNIRIPPMPIQSQLSPKKRQSQLVKFPSIPVTFRCLEQKTDNGLPISYSGFLLDEVSESSGGGGCSSGRDEDGVIRTRASAPAAPQISYERVKERTQRVRRIMGNTS